MNLSQITTILGDEADYLLKHQTKTVTKNCLSIPGPDTVKNSFTNSDRNPRVLRNLHWLFNHGRLKQTGYLSILPVDQGIEHTAGYSFEANPDYFGPENILKLAIEGGCNAVATTLGVLGLNSRSYAGHIPFIVKLNHNELLTFPNHYDQIKFGSVKQAYDLGASGVGYTIYFGSPESNRQIQEVSQAFAQAHQLGMFTVLWCYLRNPAFKTDHHDYHVAADLTGQALHLGVTIQADIVKQKLPTNNGGFAALSFGKYNEAIYIKLATDHPIDLVRYQVANAYLGQIPLINSGGESTDNDLHTLVRTAVINKRAGGSGLISGRKIFKKPLKEGVKLLNAIQDVYLEPKITLA